MYFCIWCQFQFRLAFLRERIGCEFVGFNAVLLEHTSHLKRLSDQLRTKEFLLLTIISDFPLIWQQIQPVVFSFILL